MTKAVTNHKELFVRSKAFELAMEIFRVTATFPKSEQYALTDQIRRSSRSVASNIAEAWEKRRYEASFCAKLTDSCAEVAETREWLDYAFACGYIDEKTSTDLDARYGKVLATLQAMILHSE